MSRSISRRDVAYPRGRRKVIPFPKQAEARKPIAQFHDYFDIEGILIHAVGERWRVKDAADLGFETYPIPNAPGIVYSLRLLAEDAVIQSVSRAEYERRLAIHRAARTPRAETLPLR